MNFSKVIIFFIFSYFFITPHFTYAEFLFNDEKDRPIEFKNGIYEGEKIDGWSTMASKVAHGKGVFKFLDNTIYEGNFKNDRIHGKGNYTDVKGIKHYGKWNNGRLIKKISPNIRQIILINTEVKVKASNNIEIRKGIFWHRAQLIDGDYKLTTKGKRNFNNNMLNTYVTIFTAGTSSVLHNFLTKP